MLNIFKIFKRKNPHAREIRACDSLLEATEHVWDNPELYSFSAEIVPENENQTACILAWAGYFYNQRLIKEGVDEKPLEFYGEFSDLLFIDPQYFYDIVATQGGISSDVVKWPDGQDDVRDIAVGAYAYANSTRRIAVARQAA